MDSKWQRKKNPRPTSRCFRVEEVRRGCAKTNPDFNREPGFLVIAIEKVFSFRDDWHQDDRANALVRQYQAALDSIVESRPELHLERCLVRCKQCGIRFLTHPRNADRTDLRCPFGCREHARRQAANRRSTAHYRTARGKETKERLNRRRYRPTPSVGDPVQPALDPQATWPPEPRTDEGQGKVELRLEEVVLDDSSVANSPMLPYLRMVVSLIEGIRLTCQELVRLLRQALRQRSFAFRRRIDYVLRFLNQHPP